MKKIIKSISGKKSFTKYQILKKNKLGEILNNIQIHYIGTGEGFDSEGIPKNALIFRVSWVFHLDGIDLNLTLLDPKGECYFSELSYVIDDQGNITI